MPAGTGVALYGLRPRLATAAWLSVLAALVIGQLGAIMGLDHWAMDVSP